QKLRLPVDDSTELLETEPRRRRHDSPDAPTVGDPRHDRLGGALGRDGECPRFTGGRKRAPVRQELELDIRTEQELDDLARGAVLRVQLMVRHDVSLHGRVCGSRNAYLATVQVPRKANSETTTADGTLDDPPPDDVLTMFGPKSASKSTASHITVIASDAASSRTGSPSGSRDVVSRECA